MWFRKDFRLFDNQALNFAIQSIEKTDRLVCVFQINPEQIQESTANNDYFFATVNQFFSEHPELNIHYLVGQPVVSFKKFQSVYPDWSDIYFNEDESVYGKERDDAVLAFCLDAGISSHKFPDNYLLPAKYVLKNDGTPYKVFTPFYKKWQTCEIDTCLLSLADLSDITIQSNQAFSTDGLHEMQRLLEGCVKNWTEDVGEKAAIKRLESFIDYGLVNYANLRDYPSIDGTSRLSPYLKTGNLSIRFVWQRLLEQEDSEGKSTFMKELVWREFYKMIDVFFPRQRFEELQEHYQQLPWRENQEDLINWKQGQTGFPIIDAAMRQLNETGWMHNRLRMLTACFLTKDLLIDWRLGEKYFRQQLIDCDPPNNIGGWQWAASTGTDAVPYFRIFNPTTQSKKFDRSGDFIRSFVPELAGVPDKYIHEPHLMTLAQQEKAACIIGKDYPWPMVNHQEARELTLLWFKTHKK